MNKITRLVCSALLAVLLLAGGRAEGAIILYEGFDYGAIAGSLAGKGAAGDGWSGAWTVGSFTYGGSPSYATDYQTGGLTFSDLPVTGGNGYLFSNWDGGVNAGRQHSVAVTGNLWGSFLFQRTTSPDSTALFSLSTTAPSNPDGYGDFVISPDKYAHSMGSTKVGGYFGSEVTNSGTAISTGTTYLALFKVENLGGAGTKTATSWILSEAQYDYFKADEIIEAELNAAGLGTGATQVLQRGTASSSESAVFGAGGYLDFQNYYVSNGAKYDELRISTTSLQEAAVPEPAIAIHLVSLLGVGGVACWRWRRKRRAGRTK